MQSMIRMTCAAVAFSLFAGVEASAGNIVVNGDFATGTFQGWSTVPASQNSDFGVVSGHSHSGTYAAEFGANGVGDFDAISQHLTTIAGATYKLDFWLANTSPNSNDFQVYWGNTLELDTLNSAHFGYTEYTYTLTAATNDTQLLFQGYQVPGWYYLDDVSVTMIPAPEPSTLALVLIAAGLSTASQAVRRRFAPVAKRHANP